MQVQGEHFREQKLQSGSDQQQIEQLTSYIQSSVGSDFDKFDNFPKYVQRSAISRFMARSEVFKLQLNVPGSILDLGVGRGASLFTWCHLSEIFEPVNYTREIIGFDTFEGVLRLGSEDESEHSNLVRVGGFQVEAGMYQDLQQAISIFDINRQLSHIPKVRLVRGDVVQDSFYGLHGVNRMKGGKNEVIGLGRVECGFHRFQVPHFTDHDDVGTLSYGPFQGGGK